MTKLQAIFAGVACVWWADTRSASAAPASPDGPSDDSAWLHLRSGVTTADTVVLDDFVDTLQSTDSTTLGLGVGIHWRTAGFDFGLRFDQLTAWSFEGLERANRVGAQFRTSAELRWRYVDDRWGALYISLNPGLGVMDHADPLRFQIANIDGSPLDAVGEHSLAFAFGFGFGAIIYATESFLVSIDLEVVSFTSSIGTAGREVDIDMVRAIFGAGIEWEIE